MWVLCTTMKLEVVGWGIMLNSKRNWETRVTDILTHLKRKQLGKVNIYKLSKGYAKSSYLRETVSNCQYPSRTSCGKLWCNSSGQVQLGVV